MASAVAICSCPRLGFMDFMGHSLVAFSHAGVSVNHTYGAYWHIALSEGIRLAIEFDKTDYIFTTDYDSLFEPEDVKRLIDLMEEHPEADAICSLQQGRGVQFLFTPKDNGSEVTREELSEDLYEVTTGNFGLTIFRTESLKKLKAPWFDHRPSETGHFEEGSGKQDPDIFFWHNFKECGLKAFLAPRNVIGHLEMMVKWPSKNLKPGFQTVKDYRTKGKPDNIWQ